MSTQISSAEPKEKTDIFLAAATYLISFLLFSPIITWIFERTRASEQLLHAFIILGFSGVFLVYENQERLKFSFRHDASSMRSLVATFAVILAYYFVKWPPLILVGFCLALFSLVRFTFGPAASRITTAMLTAFFIFLLLILTLQPLDWPLRQLAGSWSGWILELMGNGTQLILVTREEPQLVLVVNERPFLVAPECNGFGVLSAAILLTLLLTTYRKAPILDRGLLLIGAVMFALVANIVRILIIVSLAPKVDNYMLMHEIVGTIVFYGALLGLWWFVAGFGKAPTENLAKEAED